MRRMHYFNSVTFKYALWPCTLALAICWLALVGYNVEFERLYRPVEGGPATHPMTAISFMLLAFGCFASRWHYLFTARLLAVLTLIIVFMKLADSYLGTVYFDYLTPFSQVLTHHDFSGSDISMGTNTAAVALLLSAALLLDTYRQYHASQFVTFLSFVFAFSSLAGYLYNIDLFYGEMSVITALISLSVAFSMLAIHANRGILKDILAQHIAGRIARKQLISALLFCAVAGHLQIVMFNGVAPVSTLLITNMSMFFFMALLIIVSCYFQEKADKQRRRLENRLRYLALTNALTATPNRLAFTQHLNQLLESRPIQISPVCLLVVDIDHFKCFNDQFGHDVGDRVLIDLAKNLKEMLMPGDLLSRYGGGEFVLALNNEPLRNAILRAVKIRQKAQFHTQMEVTEAIMPLTVSIGCAQIDPKQPDISLSLKEAYLALYRAKRGGRNCVAYSDNVSDGLHEYYIYEDQEAMRSLSQRQVHCEGEHGT